jgi:nucleoside-diphosphate-sugar epimerase
MALRVLVTGAAGFIAKIVCAQAINRGFAVRGTLRKYGEAINNVELVVVGEIDSSTDWSGALRDVDVIIHLAARVHVMSENAKDPLGEFCKVNVAGSENLARAAALYGVKRLVYASSIKVNGESTCGSRKFTELDTPAPQDPYGISKYKAELALRRVANETGLEVVFVRPSLVYGAGVKGNVIKMLKVLAKGIPLPLASVGNMRSLLYVENLADALLTCAIHPAAAGQTYLVSDGEDISTPGLLRQLGGGAGGHPARLFSCPPTLLKLAGALTGSSSQIERLQGSLCVDSGKIRRELNWTPPYTLQQGLQATAEWYRNAHL